MGKVCQCAWGLQWISVHEFNLFLETVRHPKCYNR
jgi:hypothetical protein